jgi:hypothetical protein
MPTLPISCVVRQVYENVLASGTPERLAIAAALHEWRKRDPSAEDGDVRCAVAKIVAEARIERNLGRPVSEVLEDHRDLLQVIGFRWSDE